MKSARTKARRQKKPGRRQVAAATGVTLSAPTRLVFPVLIFLATLAVFVPALQNQFVDWDDYKMLLENPHYRGLGWAELHWMFTTFYMGHYQPLTWVAFGVDYLLWGLEPFGYHLTNLILHAANAALFYFVALRLLSVRSSDPASSSRPILLALSAAFAALFFSLHPLRVESVAWATERRDVLSGLFILSTILCYLRAAAADGAAYRRWLGAAVLFYAFSLLSKSIGMTLPLVLLVLDVYPLGRLEARPARWLQPAARRVLLEKLPFVLLGVTFGIIALVAQKATGALTPVAKYGLAFRLAQGLFGIAFYLWKTVFPLGLSPFYEIPVDFDPWDWPFVMSGVVVLSISIGLYWLRRRWPAGMAVWIGYVLFLFPVLGTAQSGPQLVADRYSYLSCLGWAILAAAAWLCFWRAWAGGKANRTPFLFAVGVAGLIVAGLGTLTWRQAQLWHDTEKLWRHAVSVSESNYAHYNVALFLAKGGDIEKAITHYRRALQLNPNDPDTRNNLGLLLARRGEWKEAVEQFHQALRIDPKYVNAYFNLGRVLAMQGYLDDAISNFRLALQVQPGVAEIHENLGRVLALKGEREEARQQLEAALANLKSHTQGSISND